MKHGELDAIIMGLDDDDQFERLAPQVPSQEDRLDKLVAALKEYAQKQDPFDLPSVRIFDDGSACLDVGGVEVLIAKNVEEVTTWLSNVPAAG